MNASWRVLPLVLGLLARPMTLLAQALAGPEASSAVRTEMTHLVINDADQRAQAEKSRPAHPKAGTAGAIMMDPFIVKEGRVPVVVVPHYETPLAHFIKTGAILHVETKRVSLKVDAPVEPGAHAYAKPTIKFGLSW
jgi:hypothetical protein